MSLESNLPPLCFRGIPRQLKIQYAHFLSIAYWFRHSNHKAHFVFDMYKKISILHLIFQCYLILKDQWSYLVFPRILFASLRCHSKIKSLELIFWVLFSVTVIKFCICKIVSPFPCQFCWIFRHHTSFFLTLLASLHSEFLSMTFIMCGVFLVMYWTLFLGLL